MTTITIRSNNPINVPNMLGAMIGYAKNILNSETRATNEVAYEACQRVVRDIFPAAKECDELPRTFDGPEFRVRDVFRHVPRIGMIGEQITGEVLDKLQKNRFTYVRQWGVDKDNAEEVIDQVKVAVKERVVREDLAKKFIAFIDDDVLGKALVSDTKPSAFTGMLLTITGAFFLAVGLSSVAEPPTSHPSTGLAQALPFVLAILFGGTPLLAQRAWSKRVSEVDLNREQ